MRHAVLSALAEYAVLQNDVVTRRQLTTAGIARATVRRLIDDGVIVEPFPGAVVLLPGADGPTWLQRLTAVGLSGDRRVVSHRAAARLHGIDGFDHVTELEFSVVRPHNIRVDGVMVHRVNAIERQDVVPAGGLLSTNLARTLCDLGSVAEPAMVERALDDVARTGASLRWIRLTAERLHRPGQAGTGGLVAALDAPEARGVVRDSWFEALIEQCLDDPVIGDVVPQYQLRDADGRVVARFDLAVPDVRLGIEGHSRRHHYGAEAEASDETRDHAVSLLGWDVMYLGYASVRSPASVRRDVRARVEARRRELGMGTGAPSRR